MFCLTISGTLLTYTQVACIHIEYYIHGLVYRTVYYIHSRFVNSPNICTVVYCRLKGKYCICRFRRMFGLRVRSFAFIHFVYILEKVPLLWCTRFCSRYLRARFRRYLLYLGLGRWKDERWSVNVHAIDCRHSIVTIQYIVWSWSVHTFTKKTWQTFVFQTTFQPSSFATPYESPQCLYQVLSIRTTSLCEC